mgnify:CR=1 FL=1|tara:strand:+ start:297 stop:1271 length:975 start_codon:yes stop_codon:yes gene_type:complete
MANKKISQLTDVGDVQVDDLFPLAENAGGGSFVTKSCTSQKLSEYVLNPVSATQISGLDKSVFINNSFEDSSSAVSQNTHAYLMVRKSAVSAGANDGLLTTGSGVYTASAGDNLGNHTATEDLDMAQYDIDKVEQINFGSSVSTTMIDFDQPNPADKILKVQAGSDLILSGIRHVSISGQALDLADTPISGNVTFNNGNLTVAAGGSLTIDEITLRKRSSNQVVNTPSTTIDWAASNIQYVQATSATTDFTFSNDIEGQTLTMYVKNNNASDKTVTFGGGGTTVEWGGEYDEEAPSLVGSKTNLYTFVRINTKIFASAVTGYAI